MTALVMTSLKQQWYKANSYNLFQLINSVLAKSNQHWEKGKFYYHRLMENMYNLWYLCEVMIYIQELLLKSRMHIILSLCKNNVYNFVNIYIQELKKKKIMIIAKWQRYMQLHFQPICFIRGWSIVYIHQNIFYQYKTNEKQSQWSCKQVNNCLLQSKGQHTWNPLSRVSICDKILSHSRIWSWSDTKLSLSFM